MANKKRVKRIKDSLKEKIMDFLVVINVLLKYPVIFILVLVAFGLSIIQEIVHSNEVILVIQLFGILIIAVICACILVTDKNGKKYINRIGVFSFFWFASCIVLVDFSDLGLELFARIVASYEFIFLGCLIPDYFSQVEKEHDDTIKKLEERISSLENNQSHISQ